MFNRFYVIYVCMFCKIFTNKVVIIDNCGFENYKINLNYYDNYFIYYYYYY